ncbi:MAG: wax ester/triacylglycerol synthase family O-acyltransferase [Actinomycetes bacterium]
MQRLSGMDGMFLSVDSSSSNGAMGGLIIYEAPDDPEAGSAARVRARIEARLDAIPPFRWKLTGVPLGINNAYWTEAGEVDVSAHIREITLRAPGSDRELAAEIARIMEQGVDMDRPPWDFYVIHGLEGGRLAHLLRIHHGAIDGGTVPLVLDLLSDNPTVEANPEDSRRHYRRLLGIRITGGKAEAAARGVLDVAGAPARALALGGRTVKFLHGRREQEGLLALPAFMARMLPGPLSKPVGVLVNGRLRAAGTQEAQPLISTIRRPSSPFNGRVTANRAYAFAELPLADFKRAGKALGGTLNDAVVSVCAGALRRYMLATGEDADTPLVVCVPASVRTGEEEERWANHISMFFAEFPVHLEDPVERLRFVHEELKTARQNFEAMPTHLFRDAMRFVPQTLWNTSVRLLDKAPDWVPGATWNVVVSNVRGPSHTLQVCGATMAGYWPAAFLTPGIGMNITLQSYKDTLDFGFMACSDLIPDLWDMPRYMGETLTELLAAVDA